MNTKKVLYIALICSLLGAIILPMFFTNMRILPFATFLTLVYSLRPLHYSLWSALFVGFILDLFSCHLPLGFYALGMVMTTLIIYRQRRHFLLEKRVIFMLYTLLFSITYFFVELLLLALFDSSMQFHTLSFVLHLIVMPVVDALYGFIWVLIPTFALYHIFSMNTVALFKRFSKLYLRPIRFHLQRMRHRYASN
ncbi:MAG: hypothetical protein S4CHLAM102_10610 [Chlamydiia bacterium]|nr:hypothetical protein [Chlamydiia bacterium]